MVKAPNAFPMRWYSTVAIGGFTLSSVLLAPFPMPLWINISAASA
jgi:hypothetical protein